MKIFVIVLSFIFYGLNSFSQIITCNAKYVYGNTIMFTFDSFDRYYNGYHFLYCIRLSVDYKDVDGSNVPNPIPSTWSLSVGTDYGELSGDLDPILNILPLNIFYIEATGGGFSSEGPQPLVKYLNVNDRGAILTTSGVANSPTFIDISIYCGETNNLNFDYNPDFYLIDISFKIFTEP
jgi:hypothetical protein